MLPSFDLQTLRFNIYSHVLVCRYHRTVKSVIKSCRTSVSQLVKQLISVNTALITSSQHDDIQQRLKYPTGIPASLDAYKQKISNFSLEVLGKEYQHALNGKTSVDAEVVLHLH